MLDLDKKESLLCQYVQEYKTIQQIIQIVFWFKGRYVKSIQLLQTVKLQNENLQWKYVDRASVKKLSEPPLYLPGEHCEVCLRTKGAYHTTLQWNSHDAKKENYCLKPLLWCFYVNKKWLMENIHLCKYWLLLSHSINFNIAYEIFHTQSELMVLICTCASLLFLILKHSF